MKKILITGASGFVGQHLASAFNQKYELTALSRTSNVEGFDQVQTWNELETNECNYDVVIHLAGLAHDTSNKRQESDYFDVNEGLTTQLVKWINKSGNHACTLIYLSSIKTYSGEDVITELSEQNPDSVYGRSKLAAEKSIVTHLRDKCSYHILQPVMIYGKGNKGNLPRLFSMFNKIPYPFKKYPNQRSILSVNNLTWVVESLILKKVESGKYIVADDTPISTWEMLSSLFIGGPLNLKSFSIPNAMVRCLLSLSRILGIQASEKILGNLVVDNRKVRDVLRVHNMPFETKSELKKLQLWK